MIIPQSQRHQLATACELSAAGVIFIAENGGGPGVRLHQSDSPASSD